MLNKIKILSSKHNTAKESEHHFVRGQNLAVVECSLRSRTLIVKVRMRQGEMWQIWVGVKERLASDPTAPTLYLYYLISLYRAFLSIIRIHTHMGVREHICHLYVCERYSIYILSKEYRSSNMKLP